MAQADTASGAPLPRPLALRPRESSMPRTRWAAWVAAGFLSIGLCTAASAQDAPADDITRRAAARADALADTVATACRAITGADRPAPFEFERMIHDAGDAVSRAVTSDATVAAAEPILATLAGRIGGPGSVPSLALHQLRIALAASAGDTGRLVESRAYVYALLRHIDRSGDGRAPATAWHPCLVGNEYAFARQALGARGITGQVLLHAGGRHYDKLTLAMPDGSAREVYFDVTDIYRRNGAALLR